jgi:REP element-mobilizing transposase RayT
MARLARAELFGPDEIAVVHVINRVVRRCFLMGDDPVTGKNFDHRKQWIEDELKKLAGAMGIDLLGFAILSNHFHLILRSRPDVVATWDDTEVARRWLLLCPQRKNEDGSAAEPSECELNSIRHDTDRLAQIRLRLSDISWWMRLLCQTIAIRANREDEETGKFWQSRFRAVRLMDEESLLACAAYVDLNPIRAALAETLEESDHTSAQRRIEAQRASAPGSNEEAGQTHLSNDIQTEGASCSRASSGPDLFLSPLEIDERSGELGPCGNRSGTRCSDKGFLPMSVADYLELLDWTARETVPGKRGSTPVDIPPILERLKLSPTVWCELVSNFGRLFLTVAGHPRIVDGSRSRRSRRRFHLSPRVRKLLPMDS